MQINGAAPATFSGQIEIAASPQTVFEVISDIDGWPSWQPEVKRAKLDRPLAVGSVFRWKAGPSSLTSTLQAVDPPNEIGWTGTTMGIRAVHVFRFEARHGGTLARSDESWEGLIARLLKGWSRKSLQKAVTAVLQNLKVEAERRSS